MLAFNARIEMHPVMVPEDLAKAAGGFAQLAEKYA
jgi:hypothetical protein